VVSFFFFLSLPAALRAAQTCRYLIYSEADFEVFRPQGRHVAPMGVKFGKKEGTKALWDTFSLTYNQITNRWLQVQFLLLDITGGHECIGVIHCVGQSSTAKQSSND